MNRNKLILDFAMKLDDIKQYDLADKMVKIAQDIDDRQRAFISPAGETIPIGNELHQEWVNKNRDILRKHDIHDEDLMNPISSKIDWNMLLYRGFGRKTMSKNTIAYDLHMGSKTDRVIKAIDDDIWNEINAAEQRAPGSSDAINFVVQIKTPFRFIPNTEPDIKEITNWNKEHPSQTSSFSATEFKLNGGSITNLIRQNNFSI